MAPSARPSLAAMCAVMSNGSTSLAVPAIEGCVANGAMNSISSSRFRLLALIVSSHVRRVRSVTAPAATSCVMSERASRCWISSLFPAYAESALTSTVRDPEVNDTSRSAIDRMPSMVSGRVEEEGWFVAATGLVISARKRGASRRLCSTRMSASATCRDSSGRSPVDTTSRSIAAVRDEPIVTRSRVNPGRGNQRTDRAPIVTGWPSAAEACASSVALMLSVLSCDRIASAAPTRTRKIRPSATASLRATGLSSHESSRPREQTKTMGFCPPARGRRE